MKFGTLHEEQLQNFKVVVSNKTEELVRKLALEIGKKNATNPFAEAHIVVPNPNVATMLRFSFANYLGICCNVKFYYLEKYFTDIIRAVLPESRILTQDTLLFRVLELLLDENFLSDPAFAPVREYLKPSSGDYVEVLHRAYSLAALLARAYEDYSLSRMELLKAWEKSTCLCGELKNIADTERWQMKLFQNIFCDSKNARGAFSLKPQNGLLVTLAETALESASKTVLSRFMPVHFFGFSYVGTAYLELWLKLTSFHPVNIYVINPCREYWFDVETLKEERRRLASNAYRNLKDAEDPFNLLGMEKANLLLRLWARPGREHLNLLCIACGADFESIFDPPDSEPSRDYLPQDYSTKDALSETDSTLEYSRPLSLLATLQTAVLEREQGAAMPQKLIADGSITYLNSQGGIYREIEAVAAEIWTLIASSKGHIGFKDISLLLPHQDRENYLTSIEMVFKDLGNIPFAIVDIDACKQSPLAKFFLLIINLVFKPLDRTSLLTVLTHPEFMRRFGGSTALFTGFCERARIFFGKSNADTENTYFEKNCFHWEQGLRKLFLGTFFAETDENSPHITSDSAMFATLPTDVEPEVRNFVIAARSLLEDWEFLSKKKLPFAAWPKVFTALFDYYCFELEEELPIDREFRGKAKEALGKMAGFPTLEQSSFDGITMVKYLSSVLENITLGERKFLTSGVTVSSFVPMRPIPFKAIFVVGMGEGHFPSADTNNPLDLRNTKRLPADISPREKDKYIFLETLLSAREKIYISWCGRESTTGDPLESSGLIKELNQALLELGMEKNEIEKLTRKIPLRNTADHREFFAKNNFGVNLTSWRDDVALEHYAKEALIPEASTKETAFSGPTASVMGASFTQPLAPHSKAPPFKKHQELDYSTLKEFIINPILAEAKFTFGIKKIAYEDPIEIEHEPWEMPPFAKMDFFRKLFLDIISAKTADPHSILTAELEKRFALSKQCGFVPGGVFGDLEKKSLVTAFELIFSSLSDTGLLPMQTLVLAPSLQNTTTKVKVGSSTFKISVPILWSTGKEVVLPLFTNSRAPNLIHAFEGFFSFALLKLAYPNLADSVQVVKISPHTSAKDCFSTWRFTLTSTEEIIDYVKELIAEWKDHFHPYYLPLNFLSERSIQAMVSNPEQDAVLYERLVEDWEKNCAGGLSFQSTAMQYLLEVRKEQIATLAHYPPPPNCGEIWRTRLALFFASQNGANQSGK